MSIRSDLFFFAQCLVFVLFCNQLSSAEKDPCSPDPCKNGATCLSSVCICPQDGRNYIGPLCELVTTVDYCSSEPCQNNGKCFPSGTDGFSCVCENGFSGEKCELNIQSTPTSNPMNDYSKSTTTDATTSSSASSSTNLKALYTSAINPSLKTIAFTKKTFEFTTLAPIYLESLSTNTRDEDSSHFTDNDTVTSMIPDSIDDNGTTDEIFRRKNLTDVCEPNPCLNKGTCIAEQQFLCICVEPFSGTICDIDPCTSNPCENNGMCALLDGKASCGCIPPFTGDKCLERLHPCAVSNPCENGGSCEMDGENYTCDCTKSFIGKHCEEEVTTTNAPTSTNSPSSEILTSKTSALSSTTSIKDQIITSNSSGTPISKFSYSTEFTSSSSDGSAKATTTKYTPMKSTIFDSTRSGKITANLVDSTSTQSNIMKSTLSLSTSKASASSGSTETDTTTIKSTSTNTTLNPNSTHSSSSFTYTDKLITEHLTSSDSSIIKTKEQPMVSTSTATPRDKTTNLLSSDSSSIRTTEQSTVTASNIDPSTDWVVTKSIVVLTSISASTTEVVTHNSTNNIREDRYSDNIAAYAGGTAGAFVAIIVLGAGIIYYSRRVKRRKQLVRFQSVEVSSMGSADSTTSLA